MSETDQFDAKDILLSKSKVNISYEPFCYFNVDGFLPQEVYDYCTRNYPGPEYYTHRNKAKYFFDSVNDADVFSDLRRKHVPWDNLLKHFSSDHFVQDTKQFLSKGIMQSRDDDWMNAPITPNLQFSRMVTGDQEYPHTDNTMKIFSLLLYFPEPGWKKEYGGGTDFYRVKESADASEWTHWETKKFHSKEDYNYFKKNMTCFHASEYKPNNLVGLVKSHNSYHDVCPLKCPEGMSRHCLNINFRIGGPKSNNPKENY